MATYVLMKAFENFPRKYDLGIYLLTLGKIQDIKENIANDLIRPDDRVLEIGCGTGSLAVLMAKRGAAVEGIDISDKMLTIAQERVEQASVKERVRLQRLSAMELDTHGMSESFDCIVSTLVLSELSVAEQDFVLEQCQRILAKGGQLIICDEVEPQRLLSKYLFYLMRFPMQLLTFLITQAKDLVVKTPALKAFYYLIELPLMLVVFFFVPPSSRPLKHLEERLKARGFDMADRQTYLGGTLQLVMGVKRG